MPTSLAPIWALLGGFGLAVAIIAVVVADRARRRAELDRISDNLRRTLEDLIESHSALLRAFETFLPEVRDAIRKSSSASEQLSRSAARISDSPTLGLVTDELLQRLPGPLFLTPPGYRQNELIQLVEKIANDVSSITEPSNLEDRLRKMTASNYRLLNEGDESVLENYVRSEMALSALLYSIEGDLLEDPDETLERYLKPTIRQRVIKFWKQHKIADKLLGKVNDLAKSALGAGKSG